MWFKYTEIVHLRLTKAQFDHCCRTGDYLEYIRALIDKDMQGDALEDKIPQKDMQGDALKDTIPQKDMQGDALEDKIPQKNIQWDALEDKIRQVLNQMGFYDMPSTPTRNNPVSNKEQSPSGDVNNRVNSSIRNIFNLK